MNFKVLESRLFDFSTIIDTINGVRVGNIIVNPKKSIGLTCSLLKSDKTKLIVYYKFLDLTVGKDVDKY